jgi:hypothetical protein
MFWISGSTSVRFLEGMVNLQDGLLQQGLRESSVDGGEGVAFVCYYHHDTFHFISRPAELSSASVGELRNYSWKPERVEKLSEGYGFGNRCRRYGILDIA